MEGSFVDYSKVICEIDVVIGLLKEKGVKEDIDANVIFEKLERKSEEKNRVAKVVNEIISEKTAKDVEVIVVDDDQGSSDVEVLVDLKNNYTSPYNQYGNVADNSRKIFERERAAKRSGDPINPRNKEEKRFKESDVYDLFDDSLPIEEVQAIEEAIAASSRDLLETSDEKKSVTKGAQNCSLFHEELSSLQNEYFELPAVKKGENASIESTYTNHTRSDQGSAEFLFNNIDPVFETFLDIDNGEHGRASTSEPSFEVRVKRKTVPKNELASRYSERSNDEAEVDTSNPEVEVLSSLLPKEGVEVLNPQNSNPEVEVLSSLLPKGGGEVLNPQKYESLDFSKVDHIPSELAHQPKLKAVFNQKRWFPNPNPETVKLLNSVACKENEAGSNHPIPSCSKTKYEDNQPSCSYKSFQGTSGAKWEDQPVASTSGVSIQKKLQVDLVESSLENEDAAKVARIPPTIKLQDLGVGTSNQEENANEGGKSELFEEQLQYLIAVLPDADPAFLEGLVRDCEGNDERLKDFVANALDNNGGKPIYPTRGESQQKKEEEDLIKRFTDNFSVEDFLQVFPDPVGHFESETREIEDYREHSMAYLRCKFRHLFIADLMSAMKKRNFNLSLTALDLGKFKGVKRKSKRSAVDCKWPRKQSIAFLQEVAYLENKEKIAQFIEEKKAKRQKALEEAKENNELSTCGCCFDDEFLFEDMSSCSEGHLFCKDCIKRGAEVIIGDGNSHFPCMNAECKSEFSLTTLQGILTPSVFGKLVQRLQMEEINAAGIEGLETCPSCPYSTIPAPEDKIFKCLNPECLRETCRKCKEQSHIPLRCEEVEKNSQVKARTYIEDKMTEALVRTCWKCSKKFIKDSGCNKMTCTCGAMMCYLCRQPVTDYKHFNPESHRKSDLCPLYSNDGLLDFNAVKAVAEKAKEEVLQQNPDMELVHDPTLKLPDVPKNPALQVPPPPVPVWEVMDLIPANVREILEHRRRNPPRRVVQVYPYRPAVAQFEVLPLDGNPGGYLDGMMPVYIDNYQRRERGNAHVVYPPPPPKNHVPYRRH